LPTNEYAVREDVDLAGGRVEIEPHVDPASGARQATARFRIHSVELGLDDAVRSGEVINKREGPRGASWRRE
jgi:hypothetical protein